MTIDIDELTKRFSSHEVTAEAGDRMQAIRSGARDLGSLIAETSLPSREQSLAITALEETVFWANAGISRNE